MLVTDSDSSDTMLHKLDGGSIHLTGLVRERYQILSVQLRNLRSIMEKPDAYFYPVQTVAIMCLSMGTEIGTPPTSRPATVLNNTIDCLSS